MLLQKLDSPRLSLKGFEMPAACTVFSDERYVQFLGKPVCSIFEHLTSLLLSE